MQRAVDEDIVARASQRRERMNPQLQAALAERQMELEAGALILIEDTRYRLRTQPIGN